jgi:hypothetical protein
MVGVTATTHRRFAYEKQRHHPSRSRSWRSSHGRSRCRHRRRRRGTELHDEHVHQQRGDHAVHDDDAIDQHHAVDDATVRLFEPPVSEYGRQVRLGVQLGLWLELGLGL